MYETTLFCNEYGIKFIGSKDKPGHEKYFSDSSFLIICSWVGSAVGVNGQLIFLEKDGKVHPWNIGTNFVTRCLLLEGYCVIPNKSAYMDDGNWAKVVNVVAPRIRKIKVSNVACVLHILFSLYIPIHICPFKLSAYDM